MYAEVTCDPKGLNLYSANEHGAVRDCELLFEVGFRGRGSRTFVLGFHSKREPYGVYAKYIPLEEYYIYESVKSRSQMLEHDFVTGAFTYSPKKYEGAVEFYLSYERYFPA